MSFNIKEILLGSVLVAVLSVLGYNKIYLKYVEETTEVTLKVIDLTTAKEGYLLCKSIDSIQTTLPNQKCLDFFEIYVPQAFKKDKNNEFPIDFTNKNEFVEIYNLIQNILIEYEKDTLPSLSELTNEQIKS